MCSVPILVLPVIIVSIFIRRNFNYDVTAISLHIIFHPSFHLVILREKFTQMACTLNCWSFPLEFFFSLPPARVRVTLIDTEARFSTLCYRSVKHTLEHIVK